MKRKFDLRAIVFAIFALLAIVLIMIQLQKTKPQAPAVLEKLPIGERIAIVDSSYVNLPLLFIWTMPNKNWRLFMLSSDTLPAPGEKESSILGSIKWFARATRFLHSDSLAQARVGVLQNLQKKSSYDLAIDMLAELLYEYEGKGQRAAILQPVASPAHQILKGAYFVVATPADMGEQVHLFVFLPRSKNIFVIHCNATKMNYDLLRPEWQTIVQRFYPLPQTHTF